MNNRDYERSMKKLKAEIAEAHEKGMIKRAIKAIERCVKNHDMETVIVLCELCKHIAGDAFEATIELESEDLKNGN